MSQDACTCNPGYVSDATNVGPCVQCNAGLICPGGGTLTVTVTAQPRVDVASQVMLANRPIPPADSLVSLFKSVPVHYAAVQATLPPGLTLYTRQICRGASAYCVSCDGSSTCVQQVWVGVSKGSGGVYVFNVSSVPSDALVTFVLISPNMCTPTIVLSSEYATGLVAAVSSISGIGSIRLSCPTNALIGASVLITGSSSTQTLQRRLMRGLLQTANDGLAVSIIVPSNLTNSSVSAAASANLTVQGYTPIVPQNRQVNLVANGTGSSNSSAGSSTPVWSCPENSTSPIGATSQSQCVCLPGYTGDAASGLPCSPCPAGVFCSGGIIGMCPGNASAPAMSNSSAECQCNPGFYGASSCATCPSNSYCPGGGSAVGCPTNSISPPQSASSSACHCAPGYYGAPCQLCSPGMWCVTGIANSCPVNMTSRPGASSMGDCVCADGYSDVGGGVCMTCSSNTYCKVSACAQNIYNTHKLDRVENANAFDFVLRDDASTHACLEL